MITDLTSLSIGQHTLPHHHSVQCFKKYHIPQKRIGWAQRKYYNKDLGSGNTSIFLSKTYPGKRHDKRICDEEGYTFPRFAELAQDTGFQGYQPEDVIIYQPKKKPKGRDLEIDERFINSVIYEFDGSF